MGCFFVLGACQVFTSSFRVLIFGSAVLYYMFEVQLFLLPVRHLTEDTPGNPSSDKLLLCLHQVTMATIHFGHKLLSPDLYPCDFYYMEVFLSDKVFNTKPQTTDSLILLVYCINDAHRRVPTEIPVIWLGNKDTYFVFKTYCTVFPQKVLFIS